jgi:hypothetical protein
MAEALDDVMYDLDDEVEEETIINQVKTHSKRVEKM